MCVARSEQSHLSAAVSRVKSIEVPVLVECEKVSALGSPRTRNLCPRCEQASERMRGETVREPHSTRCSENIAHPSRPYVFTKEARLFAKVVGLRPDDVGTSVDPSSDRE